MSDSNTDWIRRELGTDLPQNSYQEKSWKEEVEKLDNAGWKKAGLIIGGILASLAASALAEIAKEAFKSGF